MERQSQAVFPRELKPSEVLDGSVTSGTLRVVVAATFTADLVTSPLAFWMSRLEMEADITVAPYGQLMQSLLDPDSVLGRNGTGINVLLVRLDDCARDVSSENAPARLGAAADELLTAIDKFARRSTSTLFVMVCPASPSLPPRHHAAIAALEARFASTAAASPRTHVWTHADLVRLYPVEDIHDERAERLAHIPYTYDYFAALGTLLARRIAAVVRSKFKVIAVDCDNTLWKGVCGEDGPDGIVLSEQHIELQKRLVQQHDAGMLICLCSKNNPADVEAVFRQRTEMPLREEHLVASRLNWNRKSSNLESLADELGLSLDTFVFIDDSPVECAEVREHCPSVLTLRFPESPEQIEHFLDHVWAFDRVDVTGEARSRTRQYRENRARAEAREQARDLEDFLASLELVVEFDDVKPEHLPRMAELVQRTTQFNLTSIRRRQSEMASALSSGNLDGFVATVRDRFGDYGLVGVVLFCREPDAIAVDTFLLSCRALGRGVEHRMVNQLGRIARSEGRQHVVLEYRETARSVPAREFVEATVARFRLESRADGHFFVVPRHYAEELRASRHARAPEENLQGRARSLSISSTVAHDWHAVGLRLSRIGDVTREMRLAVRRERPLIEECVAPSTVTEARVARIWAELLRIDRVGIHDDFFELGGDSLLAVRVISRIGAELGSELTLLDIFQEPTVAVLASKVLSTKATTSRIEPADRDRPLRLSFSQQRLWFIDRLEGGSAAYHISLAVRLVGRLDRPALQAALDALVERHEALRTVFASEGGEPVQQVSVDARFVLDDVEVSRCDGREPDTLVSEQMHLESGAAFDLSRGPLIRGKLLRLGASEHILLLTMHHMVSDGWSIGVLLSDLAAFYEANLAGSRARLPALPVQYADYAQWQRQCLTASLDEQLQYWVDHLRAAPELLELPLDRPRPVAQSYRGAEVGLHLDAALTSRLQEFSRQQDLTLAMTLYAAWALLLNRLSNQDDVVVGMPVANRRRVELEPLIGFFVNTLAVRVRVDPDATVREFLREVKSAMVGAYAHQDVPFEKVVEALRPTRSLSYSPIFQTLFVLQNAPRDAVVLPGLEMTELPVPLRTAQFDLLLSLQPCASGLRGTLNYATDLFDEATVQRWVECLTTVLACIDGCADIPVCRLPLLGMSEKQWLIQNFNATHSPKAPRVTGRRVHERFADQAASTPHAVALVAGGVSYSYADLNARANQLAWFLRDRGVGPDSLVTVCVERSLELVVALLATLKAGGAYIPLDANYPAERLAYMLDHADSGVLLTQQHLLPRLPATKAAVVALDALWPDIATYDTQDPNARSFGLRADHRAYVIYTSGSTGAPKAAQVLQQGLENLIDWYVEDIGVDASDAILLVTSQSFDLTQKNIFAPLCVGGRLVLATEPFDPRAILDQIEASEITHLNLAPSAFHALVDADAEGTLSRLRRVVLGGEPIQAKKLAQVAEPRPRFVNSYGPTECSDVVAFHVLDDTLERYQARGVPLGRPIRNATLYVLDANQQPVPIGVGGEICIGGIAVGGGYLGRPDLTNERFLPDPFSAEPGAQLYRTGDVGRWTADGMLEYLGRNDHQVKIRGLRIELGEIEVHLARHPAVKEAVVVARDDARADRQLVAYVTKRGDTDPRVEEMRTHLRASLPEYMVPAAFVTLESMPLSPNGKLNRRALPAPGAEAYVQRLYEAPVDELEQLLASIWADLLGVERVGRTDNFFELGGHSLLIVDMLERLRFAGYSSELRRIFESRTLADLAGELTAHSSRETVPPNLIPADCRAITPEMLPLVELTPEHIEGLVRAVPGGARNVQDIYPLAPLQQGLLFHHLLDPNGPDVYVVPTLLAVESRRLVDELIAALEGVIARHDVLRTAIVWKDLPRPVQVVYRHAELVVDEVALDPGFDATSQALKWLQPQQQRIPLDRAPLVHVRVAPDPHGAQWYVLVQLHHIVGDNTSQQFVISEVVAHIEGRVSSLPAPVSYRNHVAQTLAHTREHDEEAFFREKLSDVDEPTAPFGLVDVRGDGRDLVEAHVELDLDLADRVRAQTRSLGVTVATFFHAAWALVLARIGRRTDVVFGSVLLGRLQGDTGAQRVLGMFINTLPLRLRLRDLTARQLIERTQSELVELLTHEQASLAVAQRCSGIPGSAPLFNSLLNYRHAGVTLSGELTRIPGVHVLGTVDNTNYPITMSIDDLGRGFALVALTHRTLDPQRIAGYMRRAVCALVEALEDDPKAPSISLPVLPEQEREIVLRSLNTTRVDYGAAKSLHVLFEEQVERTPGVGALEYAGGVLTYAQLNAEANRLARYLGERGVEPGQLVGICLERGPQMVIGVLGALKAGCAYVPLDPNYPAERLRYMLEDAAPALVLMQESLRSVLPSSVSELIELPGKLKELEGESASNPSWVGSTQDPVYVIYTSGSTGEPKGTAMSHAAMSNLIRWHEAHLSAAGRQVLQFAALSFDVAFQEIFTTLCTGGTLVLLDEWIRKDARELMRFLSAHRIDRLFVPPLMLQSLAEYRCTVESMPLVLRDVITAGEQLRISEEIVSFFEDLPQCRLHNHYGPTETHVVTALTLEADPRSWPVLPTIGRPIANTQIYILDEVREPVPLGVAGEVYIAGAGVALGYLGREELTRRRFLDDPFSEALGARMYRTGDLGRWREDGTIEYLGRNDDQVKIRGYRIELGEIEARLTRHEEVKEAAVVAREDGAGAKRLVAYVTARSQYVPKAELLRSHLSEGLPDYMVPSAFVVLEALPLTPSGKLNRRALPAPDLEAYARGEYEAPQGSVEQTLAEIWKQLLHLERIGRQDNFFELGGHSLLMVQMMARLDRAALRTDVRTIYANPKLAELASRLTRGGSRVTCVPANGIPDDAEALTPEMLPLVPLQPEHIERIVRAVPGGARNIQDIYPLTALQEGFLFHHLMSEQGGDTYVRPMLLRFSSRDRLDTFVRALQSAIDRHDVLRTSIHWEHLPQAVQVVHRRAALTVEILEFDRTDDVESKLRALMAPDRQRLNLSEAPLMHLKIAPLAAGPDWYALLQVHHLTCDAVSLHLMISEVTAFIRGETLDLPAPAPYRNHVAAALAHARENDAEAFFRAKLGDIDEPTAPFGLLDVRGDGTRLLAARDTLPASLAGRVRAQARRLGVSSATLFHLAWALVVAATSGRSDVVFGSVLLGRLQNAAGAQRTLGMFINTLPIRLTLSGVTAEALVRATHSEIMQLLDHEQASLAVAQRCSGIAGAAPLFTSLLNFRHSAVDQASDMHTVEGMQWIAAHGGTNYPIALSVDDVESTFVVDVETDRSVEPQRLLAYVTTALQSLVDALERAPDTAASSLRVLPEGERMRVLREFNATDAPFPADRLVHEVFEAQVARNPNAPALLEGTERLTYGELDTRANRLAHHLVECGVRAGDCVPIVMQRSIEMIVAELAVLKAGAVYVPIDSHTPAGRQEFMIHDCAARCVIFAGPSQTNLSSVRYVDLERDANAIARMPRDALRLRLGGDAPAYVMYTSGSTGIPKGVIVPHRAINRLAIHNGYATLGPDDCVAHCSNPAFDASTFEIWGALLNGARLAIVSQSVLLDATRLGPALNELRISAMFLTTALFNQHAASAPEIFAPVRYLLVGGEACDAASMVRVMKAGAPKFLVNAYGPTETTTFATTYVISDRLEGNVPIGRPISNTRIYILNEALEPVPIGATGEIYIGGAGVACGYLNRPELSREKFVPDPFAEDPDRRMYRTGDLGRWRPDGHIEYLGRNDQQVKIRGFRIEPGEIEAQLSKLPSVRDAVVVVQKDGSDGKRLVAYVTACPGCDPKPAELRERVASLLPEFMIPAAFVVMDRLPLTANGKLDRGALPVPELEAFAAGSFEEPEGHTELALARMWRQLLHLERVGRRSDFFEIGGHSLHGMRLVALIEEQYGIRLPVPSVFRYPTIEQLAQIVDSVTELRRDAIEAGDGVVEEGTV